MKSHIKAVTLAIGDGANDVSMIKCEYEPNGMNVSMTTCKKDSDFKTSQLDRYLEA